MSSQKYIGLDVHQATISVAVMDGQGKVVMESILETKASTLVEFFAGLRGSLFVTFEEGTWAAWLYDLLKPHVSEVLVCNPRKIPLHKQGNKSDKIDARKLAERLRLHDLKPVYHGQTGIRMLRELARSYLTIVKDPTSLISVWAVITSIPSMRVRSTPAIRCSSLLRSKWGAFLAAVGFVLDFCVCSLLGWVTPVKPASCFCNCRSHSAIRFW